MQKTEEEWKTIPHTFGRYSISTLGQIKSHDTFAMRIHSGCKQSVFYKGKMLKPTLGKNGYYYVSIVRENGKQKCYIHRLMLETFVGDRPNMEANHLSGIKTDNRLSNLEWVTGSGNMQHCVYTLNHVGRLAAPMRRVKRLDDGTIYPSISAAARSQGVSANKIKFACEHKTLIDGSFWKIIDIPGKPTELVERAKRPVLCVETGKIYESLTEAAKDVGRCVSALSQVLSGKSHVCAGYHWRYADGD